MVAFTFNGRLFYYKVRFIHPALAQADIRKYDKIRPLEKVPKNVGIHLQCDDFTSLVYSSLSPYGTAVILNTDRIRPQQRLLEIVMREF